MEIYYPDGGYSKYAEVTHIGIDLNTKYNTQFLTAVITAINLADSIVNNQSSDEFEVFFFFQLYLIKMWLSK